MFCQNCGNQIADQAKFCSKCGKPTQQAHSGNLSGWGNIDGWVDGYGQKPNVIPEVRKKKFPVFAVGAIGLLVVAVFAIVLLVNPLSFALPKLWTRPYEEPVKNLVEGVNKMDGNLLLSSILPDDLMKMMKIAIGYDEDELADELEREFIKGMRIALSDSDNEFISDLEDIDYKVSYKIDKATELKKSRLKDIEYKWREGNIDITVQEGKHLELTLTCQVNGGKFDGKSSEEIELDVIRIDEKWYIDLWSLANLAL